MPEKSLDFSVTSGKPIIVTVQKDGAVYELAVAVSILRVEDMEVLDKNGNPTFSIKANMTLDVSKK
jgi:hypothetical protein